MTEPQPKNPRGSELTQLQALAASQRGFIRSNQAHELGFSYKDLARFVRQGWLARRAHGLYRFQNYFDEPHDDILEMWLRVGEAAVASHETALVANELSDLQPRTYHFTVPRSSRGKRPPDVTLHTSTKAIPPDAYINLNGVPTMRPEIAIIQSMATHVDPTQIEAALSQYYNRFFAVAQHINGWIDAPFLDVPMTERARIRNYLTKWDSQKADAELREAYDRIVRRNSTD